MPFIVSAIADTQLLVAVICQLEKIRILPQNSIFMFKGIKCQCDKVRDAMVEESLSWVFVLVFVLPHRFELFN